jgi:hypothetical protein
VHDKELSMTPRKFRLRTRTLVVAFVALAVAAGAYAFTAANVVPNSNAGAGSATVSGYAVTNLHYALDATTPTNIDSLTFTVNPVIPSASGGKVVIQATQSTGGSTAYDCTTNSVGDKVTCATTSPQLTSNTLTGVAVIAAQ